MGKKEVWKQKYLCKKCGQEIKIIIDWGLVTEYKCYCGQTYNHKDEMELRLEKVSYDKA